ncbi:MAG: YggT family protein, partial [Blastocatellia bacterium]
MERSIYEFFPFVVPAPPHQTNSLTSARARHDNHLFGGGETLFWLYSACLWLAPAVDNPVVDYWRRNTDPSLNPFRGIYQLNGFDFAVMLPYFIVLVILAAYGIHRYTLVYNYFKNRKHAAGPPPEVDTWPRV